MASDNWQEAAVLPPYRRLVLDEAHHLEDVAAMHLGAQVSRLGVGRLPSRALFSSPGSSPATPTRGPPVFWPGDPPRETRREHTSNPNTASHRMSSFSL